MVWSEGNVSLKNPVTPPTPPGIDPGTVRLAAQRLNYYATPGPILLQYRNQDEDMYVEISPRRGMASTYKI